MTACAIDDAAAQDAGLLRIHTRDGVAFSLPSSFRERSAPAPAPATAQGARFERAYADISPAPIQLFISRDETQRSHSLPPPSDRVTADYRAGFLTGVKRTLQRSEISDVSPGRYDPAHGAFSIAFRTRSATGGSALQSIAFFTSSALVQILIIAPPSRESEARAIADQIVSSSEISEEAKLDVSMFHELEDLSAFTLGRLLGSAIGPVLAVLLLGIPLAWLLTRLGARTKRAALAGCALAVSMYVVPIVWRAEPSIFNIIQLVSALVSSALLVLPMNRWLAKLPPRA